MKAARRAALRLTSGIRSRLRRSWGWRLLFAVLVFPFLVLGGRKSCSYVSSIGAGQDPGERLHENSGLVVAGRRKDAFWSIADSGSEARLYAVDKHGKIETVHSLPLAKPDDWEALASDGENRIFIADIGDNFLARPTTQIIELQLDTQDFPRSESIVRYRLRYPREAKAVFTAHDAESLVYLGGQFYIFTKMWTEAASELYRFESGAKRAQELQTGVLVDRLSLVGADDGWLSFASALTGAALDSSAQSLALLTYRSVLVFRDPSLPSWAGVKKLSAEQTDARMRALLQKKPQRWSLNMLKTRQCEGISFIGPEIYISNEHGRIFELPDVGTLNASEDAPEAPHSATR